MFRTRPALALVACSALVLVLALPVSQASTGEPSSGATTTPALVPTTLCACQSGQLGSAPVSSEFRGHGPPRQNGQPSYDEQLGITFTQSFSSLEYNVTAMEQTDPTSGDGPAYLLNGLSNNGFWYQVGVSWNWGPGQTPGTGFDMNYEVFDPFGRSILPVQGGGISSLSGTVNEGDIITLDLYFGSSGQVFMVAKDLNTGAFAQQTFSSEGGTYFTGLTDSPSDANGFFTGLMTEWYHGQPYYANLNETVFSSNFSISLGLMWMDEFNPQNNNVIFASNASLPESFTSEPSTLQEFSYNSTTEYADANEFVTGALNSTQAGGAGSGVTTTTTTNTTTTTAATPQATMTFSYAVQGGGDYGVPVLSYVSNGSQETSALSITPMIYKLDKGSSWSVSGTLPGSTASERWVTNGTTSGIASDGAAVSIRYQTQYYVAITTNDPNGGSVQPSSGWYNSGTELQLVATSNTGWRFEGWSANNQTSEVNSVSASPSSSSVSRFALQVSNSTSEVAIFYPGLVVTTPSSVSVSYSLVAPASGDEERGTIQPGTTQSIYLPPSSVVRLVASPTSFLYSSGWSISGSFARTSGIVLRVLRPDSIAAESAYNYMNIGIIIGAAVLIAAVIAVTVAERMRRHPSALSGRVEEPSPGGQPTAHAGHCQPHG